MMVSPDEYALDFFKVRGFERKTCSSCGRNFWTLDPDRKICGDSPCAPYSFIDNPPTRRRYSIGEMRELFLSYFERRGHARIRRYPVVARWRDDIFLTIASIACFQPHVTSGEVPPPFNPLTISQPCIRMNDLDNVGKTGGRHLSIFEMMAHHAFSSPASKVYWKDETVEYHHDFLTKELGIHGEEVTYIEHWWEGGGDAGPDLEGIVRGIELSTLVFMQYRKVGGEYRELPIKIVDTGYGLERFTWVSQGTPTAFEAIYGRLMEDFISLSGVEMPDDRVLAECTRYAGLMDIIDAGSIRESRAKVAKIIGKDPEELDKILSPFERLLAVLDHTKALAFMLGDGIVPSNVKAGYLARLLIRRTIRAIESLGIRSSLADILAMQVDYWKGQFPELSERVDYIRKVADLEVKRYARTIEQGKSLVSRLLSNKGIRESGRLPTEKLIELYDSNGLPPEIVKEVCSSHGIQVEIPDTFDTIVAGIHASAPAGKAANSAQKADQFAGIPDLPSTDLVYYSQPSLRTMRSKVLYADAHRLVLDRTIFYPEGGGQLSDSGKICLGDRVATVSGVFKSRGVVVHLVDNASAFKPGDEVVCEIDWERRASLARHHSSTHILLGAARRVLGDHVWQEGAQKYVERSRLDISHYEKITPDQLREIEILANRVIEECRPIRAYFEERNRAEQSFGMRLYQGGVVYGPTIRVVEVEGWDVEACGGIHCSNTGEIGFLKIINAERIQDGVERIEFASGPAALAHVHGLESKIAHVSDVLNSPSDRLEKAAEGLVSSLSESKKAIERLRRALASEIAPLLASQCEEVGKFRLYQRIFSNLLGEDLLPIASSLSERDPSAVVFLASAVDGSLVVMAGELAVASGVDAGRLVSEAAKQISGKGGGKQDLGQGRAPASSLKNFDCASTRLKGILLGIR
ncbi:MAG: alanine--tRNA ligase [Candidatus Verstraetearchaeota archaeon]|nr:alanine--tRNA ligase [Candidatus Verstraetearchaeota archaeon]